MSCLRTHKREMIPARLSGIFFFFDSDQIWSITGSCCSSMQDRLFPLNAFQLVSVVLRSDVEICRDGVTTPSVLVHVWSVGVFDEARNPQYAQALIKYLQPALDIPEERYKERLSTAVICCPTLRHMVQYNMQGIYLCALTNHSRTRLKRSHCVVS